MVAYVTRVKVPEERMRERERKRERERDRERERERERERKREIVNSFKRDQLGAPHRDRKITESMPLMTNSAIALVCLHRLPRTG